MKHRLIHIFFTALVCFAFTVQAKALTITASSITAQDANCYYSGKIIVKLDGIDYNNLAEKDQFTFYVIESGTTTQKEHHFSSAQVNSDLEFELEGYNPGSYELYYSIGINFIDYEGYIGQVSVGGTYDPLVINQTLGNNKTMSGTRHTLSCKPTGRIQLSMMQGKFPYSVELYKDGQLFRTDVFNAPMHSGTDPHAEDYIDYYNFNDLSKGDYTFIITDACGYEVKLLTPIEIKEVPCPASFVSASVDTNTKEVVFSLTKDFFNDVKYDANIADWLEFRYKLESDPWSAWQNYTYNISEPVDITTIYGKKYSFEVRVKGCPNSWCNNDLIITQPVTPPCKEKKDIMVSLSPIPGTGGFFCPCEGGMSTPIYEDKYAINLNYTLCQATPPLTYRVYDQTAGVELINIPTMGTSGGHREERNPRTPEEGHLLQMSLTDALGKQYIDTLIYVPIPGTPTYTPPTPSRWTAGHEVLENGCNNPTGSVSITLNCRVVPAGTKVKLIQAPNGYSYTAEYTGSTSNSWTITGNSFDFRVEIEEYLCARRLNMVFDNLFHSGVYKWQITDDSGRNDLVTYSIADNFRKYKIVEEVSFTTNKNCHGTIYYPKAKIESFLLTNPSATRQEQVKFRVTSGNPTGYEINGGTKSVGICNQDELLITKPGIYTIEAFYNSDPAGTEPDAELGSCTTSSKMITYVVQPLDFKKYSGNLCADQETGEVWGNIKAEAKEDTGLPPYSYYLYSGTKDNQGKLIASSNTGVFDNIVSGSAYFFVQVEDACLSSVVVDIPLTPIIISNIILGDCNVCVNSEAHLLGKTIGAGPYVTYLWKGADGFTSNQKKITTNKITEPTVYSLEVEGFGCKKVESVTLRAVDFIEVHYEDIICEGTDYIVDGNITIPTAHLLAGIHEFDSGVVSAQAGCDSIAYFKLRVVEPDEVVDYNKVICDNNFPVVWNGLILGEGTVWADTTYTYYANGKEKNRTYATAKIEKNKTCRYYEQLKLTVNPTYNDTLKEVRCEGEQVIFGGKPYIATGVYTDYFRLPTTCDSLSTLNLTVNPVNKIVLNDSIYLGRTGYDKYGFYYPIQNNVGLLQDSHLFRNQFGCDSLVMLNLSVLSTDIVVPEGFSPNGDGINDYLKIKNIELYPDNHLLIFNRWGNKLYEGKPYMNEWDGRNYEGGNLGTDELPVGTYFYILDLGDGSSVKKGFIYLAR
jgi:gliding motility-associated-like protein